MALVNPNIAMSFRQPEFRPRNALAEYAQIQQIMGGQRQAEMADMQMEELRRERDALGRIQAAIVAKGGPPDLGAAADEMIRTGRPQFITQGQAILTALRNQRDAEAYRRDFGGGAAAPSAAAEVAGVAAAPSAPAAAPSATARAVFSQDAIADVNPEAQKNISSILGDAAQLRAQANEFKGSARASGFLNQAEQLENQAASMLAVQKRRASGSRFDTGAPATDEEFGAARQALAVGQAPPVNALAPAMPPAGVNQLASAGAAAPDANAARLAALEARYRRIGNNPELASEKALLLKQIEAALQAQSKTTTPKIDVIGVAANTNEPVYFDAVAGQQFKISTDPSGKQVRVPYTGGVNRATSTVTATATSQLPPQEKAFESELGKGQADRILKSQAGARDAVGIIDTVNTGRQIMQSGMITGAGAEFLVNLNQALKTVGIDAGYADASANSQAFAANMAGNVGRIIKQFGAGTGLSNADREYAEKMAGGKITLDASAIRRILDINERAARNVIKLHNKDVSGIKTNIPLTVEEPPATRAAASTTAPPPSAVEYLRANPAMRGEFDAKYGAGAADRALKGQ